MRRLRESGIVLRERYVSEFSGKVRDALAPTVDAFYRKTRKGMLYRGVSEAEWNSIRARGFVRSDQRWCVRGEGTCFATDIASAEGYVNGASTDPRNTGRPNYVIEVRPKGLVYDRRDGYWKTLDGEAKVPASSIVRAWKLVGRGGRVIAYPVSLPSMSRFRRISRDPSEAEKTAARYRARRDRKLLAGECQER